MSTLVNLSPADMSDLSSLTPVTFSVQGVAVGTAFVAVWMKYADSDDEILVYDGIAFQFPFSANSSISKPTGSDDLINFRVVPELGWQRAVGEFRVEGFPAIVAAPTAPFVWTGFFPIMPLDSVEASEMYGIGGELTNDLGIISHFWRTLVVATPDTGTATAYNMTGFNAPVVALDSEYELGAVGREVLVVGADNHAIATAPASNAIPASPMSSTFRSFLVSASFTPTADNDISGTLTERVIAYNRNTGGDFNGWNLFFQNANGAAPRRLRMRLDFTSGAHTITSPFAFVYGLPVFVTAVVDFAEGLMKMIVAQGSTIDFFTIPITASGSFLSSARLSIGDPVGIATPWGASRGVIGLVNTFEWPVAIASGINADNVERYLQYTDGILTL